MGKKMRLGIGWLALLIIYTGPAWAKEARPNAAPPQVVVSIAPLHSLASAVMEGVGTPALLIKGAVSEHTVQLRPSQIQGLQDADILFWAGPELESYLPEIIDRLPPKVKAQALLDVPGMKIYPARQGSLWENHDHEKDGRDEHEIGMRDAHFWLDPGNAVIAANAMAETLSEVDSAHAARYRNNAAALSTRLKALDKELQAALEPYKTRKFIAFHDAYQYFERRYGPEAFGAALPHPDRPSGTRQIAELRERVAQHPPMCIFSEPQYSGRMVERLADGTSLRRGILDPLGADIPPGIGHYEALMRALARNFIECQEALSSGKGGKPE